MFHVEQQGAVEIVACGVALNADNAEELKETVQSRLLHQPQFVLDFTDVSVVDSSGLEALLDVQDQVEGLGGAVKLAVVGRLCEDALRITGVGRRFEKFDTIKAAVGSFSR